MLILTRSERNSAAACAGRIARSGAYFLDARSLELEPAQVRIQLGNADRVWLITVPDDLPLEEAAARYRRPRERVLHAERTNAGDLGTMIADASELADATLPVPLFETPRTLLTFPSTEQIHGYRQAIEGSTMFDTIQWEGPTSPTDLHDYWHRTRQTYVDGPHTDLNVAVIERTSDRYVGGFSLRPVGGNPEHIDVGYALAPGVHGQGLGTEVLRVLVDLAFAERGAERIFASIFEGNHASRRIAEKVGFCYEGTHRAAIRKRGQLLDKWHLGITRADWTARRD